LTCSPLAAAGCDDGSIRLFTAEPGRPLQYSKVLAQCEGRALALAWHPEGHTLVSGGSDGCIHCWDSTTGAGGQQQPVPFASPA
jgi:WD40 repeat protein